MKYLFFNFNIFSLSDAKIFRDNPEIVVDDSARLMWNDDISVIKVMKSMKMLKLIVIVWIMLDIIIGDYQNWRVWVNCR